MTRHDLQLAWICLLLLTVLLYIPLSPLVALHAFPWLIGAVILVRTERCHRIALTATALLQLRTMRIVALLSLTLLVLVTFVFSLHFSLLIVTVFTVILMCAALRADIERLRSWIPQGFLSIASMSVTLVAAELLLQTPRLANALGGPKELAGWATRYDRLWEANVLGLRTRYEELEKPEGVTRIVAVGDSFTWGDKIANSDSTWPARLETLLETRLDRGAVEVVNMGRNGFTTANQAELLRRLGWQFDPDLVVVQFFMNDALQSWENFRFESGTLPAPQRALLPVRYRSGLVAWSNLLTLLERQYSALRNGNVHQRWLALYDDNAVGWQQMRDALRDIAESARKRGVPVAFMMFPRLLPGSWTVESYPLRPIYAKAGSAAREAGLHVVDLLPVFAEAGGDWSRWWATPYDGHPSAAGHALAAEYLSERLVSAGLIDVKDPHRD